MDGEYKKGRYQEIITRLNAIQHPDNDTPPTSKIGFLQDEVNRIIESMRNRADQENARMHYLILAIPFIGLLIWQGIQTREIASNSIILGAILIGILLCHLKMKQVISASHRSTKHKTSSENNTREFILTKMVYLEKAIDIKKTRMLLVALFYILFFPLFLVKLHEVAIAKPPFDSNLMAYFIAFLIGSTLWYFYFNQSFEEYDDIESALTLIKSNL